MSWAVQHDPDRLSPRAQAAAVNVDPAPELVEVEGGVDSDRVTEAVGAAADDVSSASAVREAAVEAGRARVRAARSAGRPGPEALR